MSSRLIRETDMSNNQRFQNTKRRRLTVRESAGESAF